MTTKFTEGDKVTFKKLGKTHVGVVKGFHPRFADVLRVEYTVKNAKHGDRQNETCQPCDSVKLAA